MSEQLEAARRANETGAYRDDLQNWALERAAEKAGQADTAANYEAAAAAENALGPEGRRVARELAMQSGLFGQNPNASDEQVASLMGRLGLQPVTVPGRPGSLDLPAQFDQAPVIAQARGLIESLSRPQLFRPAAAPERPLKLGQGEIAVGERSGRQLATNPPASPPERRPSDLETKLELLLRAQGGDVQAQTAWEDLTAASQDPLERILKGMFPEADSDASGRYSWQRRSPARTVAALRLGPGPVDSGVAPATVTAPARQGTTNLVSEVLSNMAPILTAEPAHWDKYLADPGELSGHEMAVAKQLRAAGRSRAEVAQEILRRRGGNAR